MSTLCLGLGLSKDRLLPVRMFVSCVGDVDEYDVDSKSLVGSLMLLLESTVPVPLLSAPVPLESRCVIAPTANEEVKIEGSVHPCPFELVASPDFGLCGFALSLGVAVRADVVCVTPVLMSAEIETKIHAEVKLSDKAVGDWVFVSEEDWNNESDEMLAWFWPLNPVDLVSGVLDALSSRDHNKESVGGAGAVEALDISPAFEVTARF